MRYIGGFLLFLSLVACSPRGQILALNKVDVQPFIDLRVQESIMLSFPQNLSQADFKAVRESMITGVRMRGFQDILDIDEHDFDLKAAQINDFSLERNIQRLYDNLGVSYFLDMQVVSRKPSRNSGLGSQLQYREAMAAPFAGSPGMIPEPEHRTITRYTLYQTNGVIPLASMEVMSRHLQNNQLDARVVRQELEALFQQIFMAVN
ncbi:hypothetical protein [Mongoliitalea daihaiensis]|uniref:hypothetical protein n=1 Tax=Mongoliitalea daihaiensis TaxID=2782006 RepID=UPI001F171249|nr:hypothetical protein [Mongoliitalea daihaiensis]UJP63601.1 hypothetical protein IPZ59_12215 [Mongoliitalea daihaiensis]